MEAHGAAVVVSAHGELDITSGQRFDDRLAEAAAASDQVILDMSAVDFMDTKALWITGLADRLPMYDTVDDALAALAGTGSGAARGPGASEPGEPEASAG